MKVFILSLLVAFCLVCSTASASPQVAQCYWPRDSYWHYSPGYNVWFKWYYGSTNPVGFWYFGPMTNNQYILYWAYC